MHVVAKPALVQFWKTHPDARSSLTAWFKIMQAAEFGSFAQLREVFAAADQVDNKTVFNISGNKYRLIAAIHYNRKKVYIRHVLTHADYDKGKWKTS